MIITNIYQVTLSQKDEPNIIKMYEEKLKEGWVKVMEDTSHATYELRRSCIVPSDIVQ